METRSLMSPSYCSGPQRRRARALHFFKIDPLSLGADAGFRH
jgi:hypothetical protein